MNDLISRQAAIDAVIEDWHECCGVYDADTIIHDVTDIIENLPSAQPKAYTKADYIMALHKEYGCTLTRAEEAHDKALEYLRSKAIVKG